MTLQIYCDGGARGNPGPAACAFVVYTDPAGAGEVREKRGKYLGEVTNNVAEYSAVVEALMWLKEHQKDVEKVEFFLDSKLVVNQLNGKFKIKEPRLRELLMAVRELEAKIGTFVTYSYIPRERNTQADELVNAILDKEAYANSHSEDF